MGSSMWARKANGYSMAEEHIIEEQSKEIPLTEGHMTSVPVDSSTAKIKFRCWRDWKRSEASGHVHWLYDQWGACTTWSMRSWTMPSTRRLPAIVPTSRW